MKFIFPLAMVVVVLLAAACGASSKEKKGELNDKKVELKKLKDQEAQLSVKIKTLEEEIAKLDPSTVPVNAKLVHASPLVPQNFVHYIDLQGKVDADNIAWVSPRNQGGQVREIYVKEGDNVRKGQLLMKLDDAIVRQQIEQVKVQLDLAKSVYERRKNLWDQKIGTEVELLQAKTNVENLQKQLDLLNEQLNMSNVYAEIPGVADQVTIKVGELFSPQFSSQVGIRIVNTTSLKAVVDVPENYLSRVHKGTPVVVVIPDLNKSFNSQISLVSQLVNSNSRGVIAEAKIPGGSGPRPNQVAMFRIQDYAAAHAIVVPMNTVQTDQNGKYVYIAVVENGKTIARKRPVAIGELNGDQVEIKQGLQASDKIITQGFQSLYDGQLITLE